MSNKSSNTNLTENFHALPRQIFIVFIAIISQIIFFSSDSFRLSSIEIKGISKLKGGEVIEQCYPPWGKYLWLVNTKTLKDRLAVTPWIKDAEIYKSYPNSLSIVIEERNIAVAAASSDASDKWFGADSEGCVLMELAQNEAELLPRFISDDPIIINSMADKAKIKAVIEIDSLISKQERSNIKYYKIDRSGYVSFFYKTGSKTFEVKLGTPDKAKEKLEIFKAMTEQMRSQLYLLEYIDLRYAEPVVKLLINPDRKQRLTEGEVPSADE